MSDADPYRARVRRELRWAVMIAGCLRWFAWIAAVVLFAGAAGCQRRDSQPARPPPNAPPPGYGQPGAYPPPGYGQPGPYAPPAAGAPPGTMPPAQPAPSPQVAGDPINAVDLGYLRSRAQQILGDLVAALPAGQQQRVQGIPLVVDSQPGEVNAFAACSQGKALMAISDGLLEIQANLAQASATDELFGTATTDAYIQLIARNQRPNAPIVRPPPGFFTASQHNDPRKVARQHQIFDEQVAFVLGHELGHHYLGHLPCTAGGAIGPVDPGELNRALSSALPLLNQPNELAADVSGTRNVLAAGSRRSAGAWTEGGALLTMRFFAGLDQLSPADILFSFERSHPPPQVRTPVIQQTANTWRFTGGAQFPFPGFGG